MAVTMTKDGVKITETVGEIDGMETVTRTATIQHRGRTLGLQVRTVDGKVLYRRQMVFGQKVKFRLRDTFAWIKLGFAITPSTEVIPMPEPIEPKPVRARRTRRTEQDKYNQRMLNLRF